MLVSLTDYLDSNPSLSSKKLLKRGHRDPHTALRCLGPSH